jgi:hypothetical protein
MRRQITVIITTLLFSTLVIQSCPPTAGAETVPHDADTRLHLLDGAIVTGRLVERSDDLIIINVNDEIFTFDAAQVDQLVALESLGENAEFVTMREFPYISFLGGTAALGLLAWIQFSNASDDDSEAQSSEELVLAGGAQSGLLAGRAAELRKDADRARLYGWSSALLAVGTLGVALKPHYSQRRIFPQLSFDDQGDATVSLAYHQRFF